MTCMHPYVAHKVVAQHQRDLAAMATPRLGEHATARRVTLRPGRILHWRIFWSGAVSGEPGSRTWMIIISVRR